MVPQDHDRMPDPPHGPGGGGHSHGGGEVDSGARGEVAGERGEMWQNGSRGSGGSPLHNLS